MAAKTNAAQEAQDVVEAQTVTPSKRERVISEDKGGGLVNVFLGEGETDKYFQLLLNNKTVDSQQSKNGFVQLRFPNGWPKGDFQYKVV